MPSGKSSEVPGWAAAEMAKMGACVEPPESIGDPLRVGKTFVCGGQPFTVTRELTRQEFTERVHSTGAYEEWLEVPEDSRFWEVSTD